MTNDRVILEEYTAWCERPRDDSIDAFLKEREGEFNARRIADALVVLDGIYEIASANHCLTVIRAASAALIYDRPSIIDSTLTGIGTRTFT
jgi:hypothetical protein